MAQRFHMKGLRECERALSLMKGSTARGVLKRFLLKRAEPVAQAMEAGAPVLTGRLKRGVGKGVKLTRRQRGLHRKASAVEVFAGADGDPAAIAKEFGTFSQPAEPFARPGWERTKMGALDGFAEDLGKEIAKTARRVAKTRV